MKPIESVMSRCIDIYISLSLTPVPKYLAHLTMTDKENNVSSFFESKYRAYLTSKRVYMAKRSTLKA